MGKNGCFLLGGLAFIATLFLVSPPAGAQEFPIGFMERIFGPTDINGLTGNSSLAAAFSARGNLTVLRWPSPGYYDQMSFLTISRDLPRLGALPNAGSFAGIYYVDAGGSGAMSWLTEDPWSTVQYYRTEDSDVLVTEYLHEPAGLRVTEESFVLPDADVLVRRFRVERDESSPVTSARLFYFENFAPCLTRIPQLPVADWLLDGLNDHALVYKPREEALLHFRPAGVILAHLIEALIGDGTDPTAHELDLCLGRGVYIAVGSDRSPRAFQCGHQGMPLAYVPLLPQGAYYDADDGALSGHIFATGHASGALAWDLDLEETGADEITVYIALAGKTSEALELLNGARSTPVQVHLDETEAWWEEWIGRAVLPDTDDPDIIRVCKRVLISVRNSYDKETGSIVASVATQPPYGEDWVRDGAYINYALDLAGYTDMVTRHSLFYADVQRKHCTPLRPKGTWSMNYYTDGVEGAPSILFEIDGVGIQAWHLWDHARFIEDLIEREAYIDAVYPSIRLAADAIVRCRDPFTGLECYYFSEGAAWFVQDLYGATAEHLGLRYAIEAGEAVGERAEVLERWRCRLEELEEAIFREFDHYGIWWPLAVLPYEDPRMWEYADWIYSAMQPPLHKEAGGTYIAMDTLSLSHIWQGDEERLQMVKDALDILVKEVPTRYTDHYGEVFVPVEPEGGGEKVFENRVSMPQLWTACLTYLTAMSLYGPWQ